MFVRGLIRQRLFAQRLVSEVRRLLGSPNLSRLFVIWPKEFDESKYITDTLTQTRAQLRQLETSPAELWSDLRQLLWFQDEPVHTMTAVVGYQLMRLAASHGIRVVLNGQGADETIGGYSSYFQDYWVSLLREGECEKPGEAVTAYTEAHGGNSCQRLPAAAAAVFHGKCIRSMRTAVGHRLDARHVSVKIRGLCEDLTRHFIDEDVSPVAMTLSNALKQSVRFRAVALVSTH
ncbi:MAG: hypothetical protein IPL14_20230 [Nitrospira sp.]|nr:hypothetical protein [Nitrospira sp.]